MGLFSRFATRPVYNTRIEESALARYTIRLVDAFRAYDSRAASQVLDEVLARVSVEAVCLDVLQPALCDIGPRWQRGEMPISGEHFATSFAVRKLGSLFNLSKPEHGRGPIVAACLKGELHKVGLLMTCLFLSRRGFRVIYLGPNLPCEDLIDTVQQIRSPLVLLSTSTPEGAENLSRSSRELDLAGSAAGVGACAPEIGFGGSVFRDMPSLRNRVDAIFCGNNADDAVATIDDLLNRVVARSSRFTNRA